MTAAFDFDAALVAAQPNMRRYANKLTGGGHGEDLVQDANERALAKRHLYDPTGGSFISWLATLMYHRFVDGIRRDSRAPMVPIDDALGVPTPPYQIAVVQLSDARAAIDRLPRGQAAVLRHTLAGVNMPGVAERLGIPVGTVKSQLWRARRALQAVA